MPDHDTAPDPTDKAYAQAEALLDDEAARAARRARVLAAVARPADLPLRAASAPARPRIAWRRGGWLAAASVAGLSVLLALQLERPAQVSQETRMAQEPAVQLPAAPATPPASAAEESPVRAPAPAPPPAARALSPGAAPSRDIASAAAAPPMLQTSPAPSPPAAAPQDDLEELVVSGAQARPETEARAATAPKAAPTPASPAARGARLRAAAAAGRIGELTALLDAGAPVDLADGDGETALMKSVQGNHPRAAALLRRHGADPDLANRAGVSARDMAASINDPELDRALGLAP